MSSERRAPAGVAPAAGGDRRRGGRRVRGAEPRRAQHRPPEGARGRLVEPRRLHLCAGRPGGLSRDGGVRGAGAPGRDGRHPRRRRRGTGRDVDRAHDRGHLGGGVPGGHDELPARAAAGAGIRPAARLEGAHHAGTLRARRGLLLPPRRQDDRRGEVHRAGAGAGAVRRRKLRDALLVLPAVQRARDRAVGGGVCADRVLRVPEPRRGGEGGGPGHAAVRDRGGRDRGDRAGRPVPARARRTGGGWWRGWSAVARFVRCSPSPAGWSRRRAS